MVTVCRASLLSTDDFCCELPISARLGAATTPFQQSPVSFYAIYLTLSVIIFSNRQFKSHTKTDFFRTFVYHRSVISNLAGLLIKLGDVSKGVQQHCRYTVIGAKTFCVCGSIQTDHSFQRIAQQLACAYQIGVKDAVFVVALTRMA